MVIFYYIFLLYILKSVILLTLFLNIFNVSKGHMGIGLNPKN